MNRALAASVLVFLSAVAPAGAVDYVKDVKPVLAKRCYACHGALKQSSDLRLDTVAAMRKGGKNGPAIEPGKADESYLIAAIDGDAGFRMPPEGEPLSEGEKGAIRAWIDAGGTGPADEKPQEDPAAHWAFRPPVKPAVPAVASREWAANPIDAFLAAGHEKRGLKPAPAASPAELLRRVTVDLTGLVPTPQELQEFLRDDSEEAYGRVVDRLLASPRYGERWGRHWMDVWRYSDWYGFGAEVRNSQPHIWRWRDWIVESLNNDAGYDRMVVAMLAGDEVAPGDPQTLRATGYLARNWYKFNRNVWLQDTVDHTAKAFLGITLACARCHDHKYDPFAQEDWYRFRAFFEPYDVRTDRVPGQADTAKDGVARVYDANPAPTTYLFRRGDEDQPDKDRPLVPALPKVFAAAVAVAPVSVPPSASYPGLLPHVRREAIEAADAAVAAAKAKLDAGRAAIDAARAEVAAVGARLEAPAAELAAARAKVARGEADVAALEKAWLATLAEREALKVRIAADDARYAEPPDSKRAEIAALAAGRAERMAAERRAEAVLAKAEADVRLTREEIAAKPADAKLKEALAKGEKALDEARKASEAAHAAALKLAKSYAPLSPIYPAASTGRRLALARWIVDRKNPLAARVAVNHVWMRHFGEPLVPTVFDFGRNGRPPTHPELLDWLAVDLMENGWSLKALHRRIVTSRAYRMRSSGMPGDPNAAIDGANAYLWRMNPRRMEAELVRDNVLYLAGALDPAMGGPDLDPGTGLATGRRSLYYRHAPEKQMTFLRLFDAANTTACYRRDVSVVPQQALALANSPLALAQARTLARALSKEIATPADDPFIAAAFERILGRLPTTEERSACGEFLGTQAKLLAEPARLTPLAEAPAPAVAPANDPRMRAREGLVHVLMNHNDFVTVR